MGCKDRTSSLHLNGFLDGSNIVGQQYNVGEKLTVILYTYINRHCCFSHSAYWLPTRKTYLLGGQSRSWCAEQGNEYSSTSSVYAIPVAYYFLYVCMYGQHFKQSINGSTGCRCQSFSIDSISLDGGDVRINRMHHYTIYRSIK